MKLELRGITKRFGSLVANDSIDVVVEPGEIHALLGENGAGKSTLMNVLYGLYEPDDGEILLDDKPVTFSGPGDAVAAGIGMVHQHFMLVPIFTVAESVALGYEPAGPLGIINQSVARKRVKKISDRFGFDVDPDAIIEDLPVGVQQRVEIIKALARDAQILILDEPTAVLTPQETDELIEIMRQLKDEGTSIVFITHKLREVRAIADSITVIRRGKVVGETTPESSETELASLMVGRSVSMAVDKEPADAGADGLVISDLTVLDAKNNIMVDSVDLTVHRGEILVVAGVQGNGQTELTETVLGLSEPLSGSIRLDGEQLVGKSVKSRLRSGLGFIPEDRSTSGVISTFTVAENFILDTYDIAPFAKYATVQSGVVEDNARTLAEQYDVRLTDVNDPISTLSGGNQQKVVVAREMSRPLRVLVASQPTRGVDVGSVEFIHTQLVAERDQGTPVLLVSSELDEAMALGDRIAVMYRGGIVDVVPGGTDRDVLGLMMAGVPFAEAQAEAAEHRTIMSTADDEGVAPGGGESGAAAADEGGPHGVAEGDAAGSADRSAAEVPDDAESETGEDAVTGDDGVSPADGAGEEESS